LSVHQNPDIIKRKEQAEKELKTNTLKLDSNNNNIDADKSIRDKLVQMPKLIHEKDQKQLEGEYMSGEQLSAMNILLETFSHLNNSKDNLTLIDNSIPSFDLKTYPPFCDVAKCKERLKESYETARSVNMHYFALKTNGHFSNFDLLRRLGGNFPETLEWYCKGVLGSINKADVVFPYDPTIMHSFSNEISRSEILTPGSTHIAVGFTDLSLFNSVRFEEGSNEKKALQWIGYEASAYCCAKTAIIATMISLNMPSNHILQVWYSASWSNESLKSFRQAIEFLLNSKYNF
jgi:hypothetical protein